MRHFFIVLLAVASTPAFAAEPAVINGAGLTSCGQFLEDQRERGIEDMYIHWAQGFLSGLNLSDGRAGKELVPLPDAPTINAYLVRHCTQNPLEKPIGGALALYKELRARVPSASRP